MNAADAFLVAGTAFFGLLGVYRGFTAQFLSLVGLAAGALAGSLVAPLVLADGSPWIAFASLAGAVVGAVVLGAATGSLARPAHAFLVGQPALRLLDRVGGLVAGAAVGLALVWLIAAVGLHQPRLELRPTVRQSALVSRLVAVVPPASVLRAIERFDPFPRLPGVAVSELPPPDRSVLESPGARAAADSVVKVRGTACGLGAQGSGWVVRRNVVATNAHVVAGQEDTRVLVPNGQTLDARVVYVDATNDVALLRVQRLVAPPLAADASTGFPAAVALLGYPRDGALTATAGTAGEPRSVIAPSAYGRNPRPRSVVPLRGHVQPGESGGPVVDRRGSVVAMIFGGAERGRGGFAVPVELVLRGLEGNLRPVSSGPCID